MTLTLQDMNRIIGTPTHYPTTEGEMGHMGDEYVDWLDSQIRWFAEESAREFPTDMPKHYHACLKRCREKYLELLFGDDKAREDEPIDKDALAETGKGVTV